MMQVKNYPFECAVRLVVEQGDYELGLGDVSQVKILRKKTAGGEESQVFLKEFDAGSKPEINLLDRNVCAGTSYTYRVIFITNTWDMGEKTAVITPEFWHSVIEDDNEVFYLIGNPSIEYTRETSTTFVQPFYSRYPLPVNKGEMNYNSGTASAIFAPLGADNNPVFSGNPAYRRRVLDFLSNPTEKRLRTKDGLAMRVFIGASISQTNTGFSDAEEVSFKWEQTGELDPEVQLTEQTA